MVTIMMQRKEDEEGMLIKECGKKKMEVRE